MKKIMLVILVAMLGTSMSYAQGTYTAGYSSKFTLADKSYSDKILTLWKDFENNTLDAHLGWFADTVTMFPAMGGVTKGKAENLAAVKAFRGSIKDLKVTVDAWISLKSTDRNQNVVCIWGNEDYTDKDGKHVSNRVQEVWAFDKDGKIALMLQYSGMGGM